MACVQTEAITIVVVITCIVFICSVVAIEGWAFRLTLCQNHILFLSLSLYHYAQDPTRSAIEMSDEYIITFNFESLTK